MAIKSYGFVYLEIMNAQLKRINDIRKEEDVNEIWEIVYVEGDISREYTLQTKAGTVLSIHLDKNGMRNFLRGLELGIKQSKR